MEFLNFNRVGLISYFFHGDLNNSPSIRHSSRKTSLESFLGGVVQKEIDLCLHPLQGLGGILKNKNLDQNSCTLFIICQMLITELQIFFNIEKKLTVLPSDNTLLSNKALL